MIVRDWEVSTFSPQETRELGQAVGRAIVGPMIIFLSGDLGAGKTCFTQGLARGLEIPDDEPVTSPSYTLMNPYRGRLALYHFDLYRLSHPDDLIDLGFEEYLYGDGVTVVEWADRFDGLEGEGLRIHIDHRSAEERTVSIHSDGESGSALLEVVAGNWQERGENA